MQEKDYKNYDYLDIIVKKKSEQELVGAYTSFLWQKIGSKEDRRYNDVVHLSFCRPHKLKNKDRLQLLQVYYESALNNMADLQTKKHSKSRRKIIGLTLFSALFLFGVGVFIYLTKNLLSIILGAVFALGVIGYSLLLIGKIKKLFIKENKIFTEKQNGIEKEKQRILIEVNLLTKKDVIGDENEEV